MDTIIDIINNDSRIEDNTLVLTREIDSDEYKKVAQYLRNLGAKWDTSKYAHVFPNANFKAVIEIIKKTGELPKINPHQLFPTPDHIIQEMIKSFAVQETLQKVKYTDHKKIKILEPSAGTGAMVDAIFEAFGDTVEIHAVEIDPINRKILAGKPCQLIGENFLEEEIEHQYDLIVMNPPFKGQEYVKHVLKAQSLLLPSGKLFTILPKISSKNIANNPVAREIARSGAEYWDNPPESFKESKTKIDTISAIITAYTDEKIPFEGWPSIDAFQVMLHIENSPDRIPMRKFFKKFMDDPSNFDMIGYSPEGREKIQEFFQGVCNRMQSLQIYPIIDDSDIQALAEEAILKTKESLAA